LNQAKDNMPQIVECIPNFSEARRPEVVDAILAALTSVPEVSLLDRSSDTDHNRTVVTYAGPPAAVEEAAFRAIQKAAELIDLDQHTGEHPRLGATDVVPFVPISGISMDECVAMARHLGRRVGEELGIPVYLYEYAALRPERTALETIRKGQYEAIKEEIGIKPERAPDYGPKKLPKAGAVVIGARDPLVAYNIYLTTNDVSIADKIARAVRHSSGGLRFVKGMGVLVEGRAQVSMNLTNFRKTPIARVVEFVRREAARYGVAIHHSELVGLIPQEALIDAAVWYTQLDQFEKSQVLETRMQNAPASGGQGSNFLDDVAAGTPAPGGGSAAAYVGALGAALASMMARLTVGKKKYVEIEPQMMEILDESEKLRAALTSAIEEDAEAFNAIMQAFKLPKNTPEEEAAREEAIQKATVHASEVPLRTAQKAVRVMELAARAARLGNLNAITDAASGAAMARAALTAAGYNVRINVLGLHSKEAGAPLLFELEALEARAAEIEKELKTLLNERGGLNLT
jgi:glutamate formiminotransferase/formiminotetrahydrofolate cyclodeaminase